MNSELGHDSVRQEPRRGVYTLANDTVIEWFEAFIRNFRKYNPTLSLTVIPYNHDMVRVQALRDQYRFEIMDPAECGEYDALAEKVKVIKKEAGCFRKFACFSGKYEEFLFLDADVVTLVTLDSLFDAFSRCSVLFVYFDVAMGACYKGDLATVMSVEYNSPAYNSGIFFSRSGLFKPSQVYDAVKGAALVCDDFAIGGEQPFLNYVTDTLRIKSCCFDSLMPEYSGTAWARYTLVRGQREDEILDDKGKVMPFVHWAGCAFPTMVRPREFLRFRMLGNSFPVKVGYTLRFYFLRYQILLLKAARSWKTVLYKFSTSSAWRKFYFCKLVGIKRDLPSDPVC